jgi:hypothetical protein
MTKVNSSWLVNSADLDAEIDVERIVWLWIAPPCRTKRLSSAMRLGCAQWRTLPIAIHALGCLSSAVPDDQPGLYTDPGR